MASFILIHRTVWRQYTNVTDSTDRQLFDSIGRTVLQTVIIIIIIIIFFNDKLTIATHYKIKDKYKINNVGLAIESSNTYENQYKSL